MWGNEKNATSCLLGRYQSAPRKSGDIDVDIKPPEESGEGYQLLFRP